jgi:hypothetical protein
MLEGILTTKADQLSFEKPESNFEHLFFANE